MVRKMGHKKSPEESRNLGIFVALSLVNECMGESVPENNGLDIAIHDRNVIYDTLDKGFQDIWIHRQSQALIVDIFPVCQFLCNDELTGTPDEFVIVH